jgi:putative toxin-antitoxin system antitoxin component (TIGR02293 family)
MQVFTPTVKPSFIEGATVLGLRLRNTNELIQALEHGFSPEVAERLSEKVLLPLTEFSRILDVALRTVQRNKKDAKPLSKGKSETLFRVARIFERTSKLLGTEEKAARWMTTPKFGLSGQTPLEYARSEVGGEIVLDLLESLADGGLA